MQFILQLFTMKANHTCLHALEEHAEVVGGHLFLELAQHCYTVKARMLLTRSQMNK